MGKVRQHNPVIIEEINGLWARGDDESCPLDHLLLADNIQFIHSGIETRNAVEPYSRTLGHVNFTSIRRIYNYVTQSGQTLLVLTAGGKLHHVLNKTEVHIIMEDAEMEDFAFISIAGRAYISPFKSFKDASGRVHSLGLRNKYVHVYYRDPALASNVSVLARPAGGVPPSNINSGGYPQWNKPFLAYTSSIKGTVTQGSHAFGVTYLMGSPTQIGPRITGTGNDPAIFAVAHAPGDKSIELTGIPQGPVGWTETKLWMSKANEWVPGSNALYLIATLPYTPLKYTYRVDIADSALTQAYVAGTEPAPFKTALTVENFIPPPPAAGQPPTPAYCDLGFHLVGVVYETNSGYLTAPGPEFFGGQTYANESWSIRVSNIPVGDSTVVKRHLVSTKAIPEYNGDQKGYQFFFIPKGTIDNNTETIKVVNYYDSDLVADASHLTENFTRIPAGVNFCEYHSRLVVVGDSSYPKNDAGVEDTKKPDNRSVAWVSAPGEPEAINQVDGLIITPLDGNPLTNCEVFRDVLHLFKTSRTYAVSDNGDDPTTWGPVEALDQGIGASVHGIAEVLDSGGINVDYLIIVDWSGLMLFNGTYARPELSWKIEDVWLKWDRNKFHNIQIVNDSINKKIWIVDPHVPTKIIYLADYSNGMNPKDIRWAKWWLEPYLTSITLLETDHLIIGGTTLYLPPL